MNYLRTEWGVRFLRSNIVSYKNLPEDVVRRKAELFRLNGIAVEVVHRSISDWGTDE